MPNERPTRKELLAAQDKTVRDIIGRNLRVLFCGMNPGLYSAAVGHHFARPGNRFWPALFAGGFTQRLLTPFEERELLESGYGITNLVDRASASASELTKEELIAGGRKLIRKVRKYQPKCVAVLGVTAYRTAFDSPKATIGEQEIRFGNSLVWVLPNPSGLNAHFQIKELGRLFRELRIAIESQIRPSHEKIV
ncbi:MAG: G/U mismatch-specific DNA glycosylase [Planctomycetaceae bacterium]|nr:G/U mismatch-specific DNA glycosylase [Planctomycetaceae bacterium]